MEEKEISSIPMPELLPQRPPFVVVDSLWHFDNEKTETVFTVDGSCIMVEDGHLAPMGLIENMAQTCAARLGYINYINRKRIKIGFIGAIRNMAITRLPRVGEMLHTVVSVKDEVFEMTLADATVMCDGVAIATAEMKIALSDSEISE